MDNHWREAPHAALRVWRGASASLQFEVNPPARRWGAGLRFGPNQWRKLVAAVFATGKRDGRWHVALDDGGQVIVLGRRVQSGDGALLWIDVQRSVPLASVGEVPSPPSTDTPSVATSSSSSGEPNTPARATAAANAAANADADTHTNTNTNTKANADADADANANANANAADRSLDEQVVPSPDGENDGARRLVQELREQMRRIGEIAGLGRWSRGGDNELAGWDEQMFRLHERPASAGVPTRAEWLERYVHPLDREHVSRVIRESEAGDAPPRGDEFRIRGDAGTVRWVTSWTERELRDGRRRSFGILLDVTQRREAELRLARERERMQRAMDAAGIGLWERGLDGVPTYWNAAMYRLRGLDPSDPRPIAKLATLTMDRRDRAEMLAQARRHIESGQPYVKEWRVRWPDDSVHWIASRGQVVRDERGRAIQMSGVNFDVTERREAEALRQAMESAEQASRNKSEFMARMSHELRTPLNGVLGFAHILLEDRQQVPSAWQRERLTRIQVAGQQLLVMIDKVLDLARVDTESRPVLREPVAIDTMLRAACGRMAALAAKRGVELRVGDAPLWGALAADPTRLAEVLDHLLSNAIRYNRRGGWVSFETGLVAGDGESPRRSIVVRDSGRGLKPAELVRLFEPFERLAGKPGGEGGSGIGLTLVRRLLQRMDGEIEVTSEPGRGSEFTVWLDDAAMPALSPAVDPNRPSARSALDAALRVVCIEDNAINMMLVREILSLRPGVALFEAVDGRSGIELVLREQPDVVLLDLQLPDLHGLEVLERLRAEPSLSRCRVVALSANAMPDDVKLALARGCDDYWTKPIDFNRFLAGIDALIVSVQPS